VFAYSGTSHPRDSAWHFSTNLEVVRTTFEITIQHDALVQSTLYFERVRRNVSRQTWNQVSVEISLRRLRLFRIKFVALKFRYVELPALRSWISVWHSQGFPIKNFSLSLGYSSELSRSDDSAVRNLSLFNNGCALFPSHDNKAGRRILRSAHLSDQQ